LLGQHFLLQRVPGGYSPATILAWIRLARSSISFGEAAVFKGVLPFFYVTSVRANSAVKQAGERTSMTKMLAVFDEPNTTKRTIALD